MLLVSFINPFIMSVCASHYKSVFVEEPISVFGLFNLTIGRRRGYSALHLLPSVPPKEGTCLRLSQVGGLWGAGWGYDGF